MKKEIVELPVEGLVLRGKLYLPEPSNEKGLALLFLHGWTGLANDSAAGFLADNGYSAMTIHLSGHGNSEGKLENQTRQKSLKEAIAAYDYFKGRLAQNLKIGVAGNSYGGYLASLLSGQRRISFIQLRVPANYPDEGFDEPQMPQAGSATNKPLMAWRNRALDYGDTKSLRSIHSFTGPIQILEAADDDVVPHQTIQNYINAVQSAGKLEYHLLQGWPHSLGLDAERNSTYQKLTLEWLEKIAKEI